MNRYALVTEWEIAAPLARVWDKLVTPEDWPRWWRYVLSVETIARGDADGLGAVRRYMWSSRLPYELTFEMRTTRVQPQVLIEGVASGELDGSGLWELAHTDDTTFVKYTWTVITTKSWMNRLAPLMAPIFRWNHNQVMREGGRGLARELDTALRAFH